MQSLQYLIVWINNYDFDMNIFAAYFVTQPWRGSKCKFCLQVITYITTDSRNQSQKQQILGSKNEKYRSHWYPRNTHELLAQAGGKRIGRRGHAHMCACVCIHINSQCTAWGYTREPSWTRRGWRSSLCVSRRQGHSNSSIHSATGAFWMSRRVSDDSARFRRGRNSSFTLLL